jgi:GT2 family glycosyltransferase
MSFHVPCLRPWQSVEINIQVGDVKPCPWGKLICGNIHHHTPEAIWRGGVFEQYRRGLKSGNTGTTCPSSCPVLSRSDLVSCGGQLPSLARRPLDLHLIEISDKSRHRSRRGRRCWLPPILAYWIATARRLTVEVEEPWNSALLRHLRKAVPRRTVPFVSLVARWWRLGTEIPIPHLREMRLFLNREDGPGLLASVHDAVQRLDRVVDEICRLRSRVGFELALGAYVRCNSGEECVRLLSLCEATTATPFFALAPVLVSSKKRASRIHLRLLRSTLNHIDKELWAADQEDASLAAPLAQLAVTAPLSPLMPGDWPRLFYAVEVAQGVARLGSAAHHRAAGHRPVAVQVSYPASGPRHFDGSMAPTGERAPWFRSNAEDTRLVPDCELDLVGSKDEASVQNSLDRLDHQLRARPAGSRHLTITAGPMLCRSWERISGRLRAMPFNACSFSIPFWIDDQPVSVLQWRDAVRDIRDLCSRNGWKFCGGRPDLLSIGLDPTSQSPEIIENWERRAGGRVEMTVLAAAYNCAEQLPSFVGSLSQARRDSRIELVLVDDGSTDATWDAMQRACSALDPTIDVLLLKLQRHQPYVANSFTFRTGAARQLALDFTRGERILFLDPDQTIEPDCLTRHLKSGRQGFEVVLGVRSHYDRDLVQRTRMRLRHVAPVESYEHWWGWFFTGNASVSQSAIQAAGGFDEALQYWGLDDMDLGYRLERVGAQCWHTPRARVIHQPGIISGGGASEHDRRKSCRFQMEVLFRKYCDFDILNTYRQFWTEPARL